MSILQQIIAEATSPISDTTRLLRLCQVLASRLTHIPLKTWVHNELGGYTAETELPVYRLIPVVTKQPPTKVGGFELRTKSPDTRRLNDAS